MKPPPTRAERVFRGLPACKGLGFRFLSRFFSSPLIIRVPFFLGFRFLSSFFCSPLIIRVPFFLVLFGCFPCACRYLGKAYLYLNTDKEIRNKKGKSTTEEH